ncbi:MAG TPA: hypothetical protein VFA89_13315 [Terriglobales bacterium]|nr:hypothetical protein [Terriglobales bacterium]
MHNISILRKGLVVCAAILILCLCAMSAAADSAPNVAGTWTISASKGRRKATQTIVLQQDGSNIKGTFKGPRQSGTLEGSLNGNAISFHVTAKEPLDYTGIVDGNNMKGTLSAEGKTGEWTATREQ